MMRLGRKASLLVAFYLLTSAASAYAECAWVLWDQRVSTHPKVPVEGMWTTVEAYKQKDECDTKASVLNNEPAFASRRGALGELYLDRFSCLPDTVDPRGPKGGAPTR
jgi:hypothetical protein